MQVRSLKKKRIIHAILFIENLKVGKTKLLLRDSYMYDTIIKKTRECLTQNPNIVVTLEIGWGQRERML